MIGQRTRWRAQGCLLTLLIGACHGTVTLDNAQPPVDSEPCEPSTQLSCGTLPVALDGVGACQLGVRQCRLDGSGFDACVGEVQPSAEDCTTSADETCDGEGACVGDTEWASPSAGSGDHIGYGVAQAPDGSVVAVGGFDGTLDLGAAPLSSDEPDAFVVKLDTFGKPLWSLAASGRATARSVGVMASGEIVVAGEFRGSIDFGAGALQSAGQTDIFVLRLSADGAVISNQRYGSGPSEWVHELSLRADGSLVLVGGSDGSSKIGSNQLPHAGEGDVLVLSVSAAGSVEWAKAFGSSQWDYGSGVAVDAVGAAGIAVHCHGSGDFGVALDCDEAGDAVVIKLDRAGQHEWTRRAGGEGPDQARSVVAAADGSWLVTGLFSHSLDFGGGALIAQGGYESYLVKLSATGQEIFSRRFGTAGSNNFAERMAIDNAGNVTLLGLFTGELSFGGVPLENSSNQEHIFVAKLTPAGEHAYSRDFGDSTLQRARDVDTGYLGEVLLIGDYIGQLDLGGDWFLQSDKSNQRSLFVARLQP